jgi:hypothetical protein
VQERVVGVLIGKDSWSDPMLAVAASHGTGGQHGERRGRCVCARCTARLGFKGGEGNRATTARGPRLNSLYGGHPRLARAGSPAADQRTTPSADGGEGRDSTWRGADFRNLGVLPNSGEVASGRREVALTPR